MIDATYLKAHRTATSMVARRRVVARYDGNPKVCLAAIALAETVIYWLGILSLERLGLRTNKIGDHLRKISGL